MFSMPTVQLLGFEIFIILINDPPSRVEMELEGFDRCDGEMGKFFAEMVYVDPAISRAIRSTAVRRDQP